MQKSERDDEDSLDLLGQNGTFPTIANFRAKSGYARSFPSVVFWPIS